MSWKTIIRVSQDLRRMVIVHSIARQLFSRPRRFFALISDLSSLT
jgi:hypothetical protein